MSYYDDKTESPTKKKIKEAKKHGMNIYSKKLNSFFLFFLFFIVCFFLKDIFFLNLISIFRFSLIFDKKILQNNFQEINFILFYSFRQCFIILFPIFLCCILSNFFSPVISKNFSYNLKMINFNIQRLNIFLGIKKIFSYNVFIKFFKILLNIIFLFLFLAFYFFENFSKIFSLIYINYIFSFVEGIKILFQLIFFYLILFLLIIILDIFFKNYFYFKNLRMSHQELKDEFKNTEGNPQIKSKISEKRKFLTKNKSIFEIRTADIIVTHSKKYAIVLKYNKNSMLAPKIIFKGSKYFFSKIIKLGKKNNILCINYPLLAKILYKNGKIGKYIPNELYSSVADVFSWLLKFRKWKKKGGKYPKFKENLSKLSNINILGKYKS